MLTKYRQQIDQKLLVAFDTQMRSNLFESESSTQDKYKMDLIFDHFQDK